MRNAILGNDLKVIFSHSRTLYSRFPSKISFITLRDITCLTPVFHFERSWELSSAPLVTVTNDVDNLYCHPVVSEMLPNGICVNTIKFFFNIDSRKGQLTNQTYWNLVGSDHAKTWRIDWRNLNLERLTAWLVHRQRIYPWESQLATLLVECRPHLSSCLEWLCNYGVNQLCFERNCTKVIQILSLFDL